MILIVIGLAGACSSGDAGGDSARDIEPSSDNGARGSSDYAAAVAVLLAGPDPSPFDAAQRDCAGRAFVEAVGGGSHFQDRGISVADVEASASFAALELELTEQVATSLGSLLGECGISLGALVVARLGVETPESGDVLLPAGVDPDELQVVHAFVDCIDGRIDDQMLGELFLSDADDHLIDATLRCVEHLEGTERS